MSDQPLPGDIRQIDIANEADVVDDDLHADLEQEDIESDDLGDDEIGEVDLTEEDAEDLEALLGEVDPSSADEPIIDAEEAD
jgi:hypothetical protein